ncbi:hypothetical protein [Shinella sp.]|uniref:hypothetical protein n=1 Tax=Shinella sp. TaxID=1870904 RepID=UPI0029AF7A1B|nr:hypothetical protein [Shinella sp.]MDX3973021.1 hypothetical protein [Shinella sp.]
MSEDVKAWYQSRTVWGALIAILASLAHVAGVEVTAGDEGELADLVVSAAGTIGGLIALYGRISARRQVR